MVVSDSGEDSNAGVGEGVVGTDRYLYVECDADVCPVNP